MRRQFPYAALAALIFGCVVLAAPPALVIPAEVKPLGDYAQWTPDAATTAKAITFVPLSGVDPFPANLLRDPRAFVLPTRGLPAGRYKFRAVGSLNDEHAQAEFVVVIGDAPAPPPGPTPGPAAPDGRFLLVKASREGAAKVTSANKAAEQAALAAANRSVSSALAAGGIPFDPAKILAEWRKANNAAAPAAVWEPWGKVVSARLNTIYQNKTLATKADWCEALNELAEGLGG